MPVLTGKLGPWGPTIHIKVMQTNQRVEALKKAGKKFSSPTTIIGLIDTGASISALDSALIIDLGLEPRGVVSLHTPTTGTAYQKRMSYDALFITGENSEHPLSKALQVIESHLASQGFFALIGRDFLDECQFSYDGPRQSFTLQWEAPWRPSILVASSGA
jgi:hypothetical protein